jgi:release factor glutamine methyltransferase
MATAQPSMTSIVSRLRAAGCVFAEDEARLLLDGADSPAALEDMIVRRTSGVPLEQILGWAEFCGLRIVVEPGVFVPRRRTEFVVDQAILALRARDQHGSAPVVVDLCCGSGAVGAALTALVPELELYATDIDPVAVACARRNIAADRVLAGDLYAPLPATLRGRIDLLVANAPYVPTDAIASMPPEARLYEPNVSLDGGRDGLDLHRRISAAALHWLAPGGQLLIETSERQAPMTAAMVANSGLTVRVERSADVDGTVVIGQKSRPVARLAR